MSELISIVLSGMFAALSYKGSFFKSPDYLLAAMAGAVAVPVFISGVVPHDSWMISASGGYIGGLVGCFVYAQVNKNLA